VADLVKASRSSGFVRFFVGFLFFIFNALVLVRGCISYHTNEGSFVNGDMAQAHGSWQIIPIVCMAVSLFFVFWGIWEMRRGDVPASRSE